MFLDWNVLTDFTELAPGNRIEIELLSSFCCPSMNLPSSVTGIIPQKNVPGLYVAILG